MADCTSPDTTLNRFCRYRVCCSNGTSHKAMIAMVLPSCMMGVQNDGYPGSSLVLANISPLLNISASNGNSFISMDLGRSVMERECTTRRAKEDALLQEYSA